MVQLNVFCLTKNGFFFKIHNGSHGFYGDEVAAPSHRRACAGVCAFLVVSGMH